MHLPKLSALHRSPDMIQAFGGYRRGTYIPEGQFSAMENLSGRHYPALTPRPRRGLHAPLTRPNGLCAAEALCWVDGTTLHYDGTPVGVVADSEKQFAIMGAYIVIFPDKLRLHTGTRTLEALEATVSRDHVAFSPCDAAGNAVTGMAQYTRLAQTDIGSGFAAGDVVRIQGCTDDAFNGVFRLQVVHAHAVVIVAPIGAVTTQATAITLSRPVPDMDYICEHNNRLWGCSNATHEIYASALGDPTNFQTYEGLSTDAYAVTVGGTGRFTGCQSFGGYVHFWKGDQVLRMYGVKPANFQLAKTLARGVKEGCSGSLTVAEERLYYVSPVDVCAYDGAYPEGISAALDDLTLTHASGGALGHYYYLSAQDESRNWHMLVYDESTGFWHREDHTHARWFTPFHDDLFFIDMTTRRITSVNGTRLTADAVLEPPLHWLAETGALDLTSLSHRSHTRLTLRLSVASGAQVRVYVQYDDTGPWLEKGRIQPQITRSLTLPIAPRRCDHMRIRLEGEGEFTLHAISRWTEAGSELP